MIQRIFIALIIIAILVAGGYWLYLKKTETARNVVTSPVVNTSGSGSIFSPLADDNGSQGTLTATNPSAVTSTSTSQISTATTTPPIPVPVLRELSTTPVGGMAASTTGTTTVVRWIDRGTGYVYQASSNSLAITELSDTTVPMIYQSFWNKSLNAFIFQSLSDESDTVSDFYAVLSPVTIASPSSASSTVSTNTPYQLRGEPLPANIAEIAVNPENTSVFTLALSEDSAVDSNGVGYISQFDGSKRTEIFDTPLTQVNVQWPADNVITLTTKGMSTEPGFLYFVNPKTGSFTNILANVPGLDTLTNHDASEVLYSSSGGDNGLTTSVYDLKTGLSQTLAFNTLPEKCVWSSLNEDDLLCAVPRDIPAASYPEAWYQGTVSFADSLWEINVSTGEVHEIADLLSLAGKDIDAEDLTLDPKENFLYFINKQDLSLWSISLND